MPAWHRERERPINRAALARSLSRVSRLALEMALHVGTEQRALDGELAELHAA